MKELTYRYCTKVVLYRKREQRGPRARVPCVSVWGPSKSAAVLVMHVRSDVRLTREGEQDVRIHGPCELLQSVVLNFRGVQVPASSTKLEGRATGAHKASRCSYLLTRLAAELLRDACSPQLPNLESKSLLALAVEAMPVSGLAPTPAFNLDDHYQLLHAVVTAVTAAPEQSVHNLEVGSFAGHSLLLQAAALKALGLNRTKVHSIEPMPMYGLHNTMTNVLRAAQSKLAPITWHQNKSGDIGEWHRPLRLFFEDSKHTPDVTRQSFDTFENRVVEGGVVVLHDVGCCVREYRSNWLWLQKRIFSKAAALHRASWLPDLPASVEERLAPYREIRSPTPTWSELRSNHPMAFDTLRRAMLDSVDVRQPFRSLMLQSEKKAPSSCDRICTQRTFISKLREGYQWSGCMNTRAFVRVVRQHPPLNLTFGTSAGAIAIEPCGAFSSVWND